MRKTKPPRTPPAIGAALLLDGLGLESGLDTTDVKVIVAGVEVDVIVNTTIPPLSSVEVNSEVIGKGKGVVVVVTVINGRVEVAQLAYSVTGGLTKVETLVMNAVRVTVTTLPVDVSLPSRCKSGTGMQGSKRGGKEPQSGFVTDTHHLIESAGQRWR
jgi:hypothetical protein